MMFKSFSCKGYVPYTDGGFDAYDFYKCMRKVSNLMRLKTVW